MLTLMKMSPNPWRGTHLIQKISQFKVLSSATTSSYRPSGSETTSTKVAIIKKMAIEHNVEHIYNEFNK